MRMRRKTRKTKLLAIALAICVFLLTLPIVSLADDGPNIDLDLTIVNAAVGGQPMSEVPSGQTFYVRIAYNLAATQGSSDGKYTGGVINIPIPAGVEYVGEYSPSDIIQSISQEGNTVFVDFKDEVSAGSSGTFSIGFRFPNMETANGFQASFKANLNGNYTDDALGMNESIFTETNTANINAQAQDGYDVAKSVVSGPTLNAAETEYTVTYAIEASLVEPTDDAWKTDSDWERYGRLDIERYILTDKLPAAAAIGALTGYPVNGGAQFVSITEANTGYTLQAPSD
jgi:hypothetical protein